MCLNFNYTHIADKGKFREINIHGSLDHNDIIIGIENDLVINENDKRGKILPEAAIFTKTFRRLLEPNIVTVLKGTINEIVIYGHSLGKQDYSYFQSIFDFAKIYSSSTVIRFVYSDNFLDEKIVKGIRLEQAKKQLRLEKVRNLFNLLESYGQTLDNKDNGRNLVHKMILEGRIKVELKNFVPAEQSD